MNDFKNVLSGMVRERAVLKSYKNIPNKINEELINLNDKRSVKVKVERFNYDAMMK